VSVKRNLFNFWEFKEFSYVKKKICAFLVLVCISVNGFSLSAINIGKGSFIFVVGIAGHNVVSNLFKSCNDSIIILSCKVLKDIQKLLFSIQTADISDHSGRKSEKKSKNTKEDNNSLSVINVNSLSNAKKIIAFVSCKACCAFMSIVKLFRLYMNCKIIPKFLTHEIILLSFMIFIFTLRRRKLVADVYLFGLKNKNLGI
jgi:hypothetical protein